MSEITNFQMACSARQYLLNRAAEAATYDWSNDFSSTSGFAASPMVLCHGDWLMRNY